MNKIRKNCQVFLFYTFLLLILAHTSIAQAKTKTEMEVLIDNLKSRDIDTASSATDAIFKRGSESIPFLMKLKGDRDFYRGDRMINPRGDIILDPVNPDGAVTIEIAALYLISAIYFEDLRFADAAYLVWQNQSPGDHRFNTPKQIRRAWQAIDGWSKQVEKEDLSGLRKMKKSPLKAAKLRFYGVREGIREPLR